MEIDGANKNGSMQIDEASVKRKGRGFNASADVPSADRDLLGKNATFDRLDDSHEATAGKAARSVEGWIVLVTGVHEEATEEDLQDKFGDFGEIKNLHLNLDRRTGYVKGYALVEYETRKQAEEAIAGASDTMLLEQKIHCDFAFIRPPTNAAKAAASTTTAAPERRREASPGRPANLRDRID